MRLCLEDFLQLLVDDFGFEAAPIRELAGVGLHLDVTTCMALE
jgi:hypothetical protein